MDNSKVHYNPMDQTPKEIESAARQALEAFITAWNKGDDAELRPTMHFPFVSFGGGLNVSVNKIPEDFSQGFDRLREQEGWASRSFDYNTLKIFLSSEEKIHLSLDYHRYGRNGDRYATGNSFYIVTKKDGHWRLQLRSGVAVDTPVDDREAILSGARDAALGYMKAFNAGDPEGTSSYLNYPHLFLVRGDVVESKGPDDSNPNFNQMRESQNWGFSTFDSLEPSVITANKVHLEVVFSRWHPDGTRYQTVPALWVMTKVDGHWGIQFRSLMRPTFNTR